MGTDENNKKGLGRREFIKLGAGSLAVSLSGCAASSTKGEASAGVIDLEQGAVAMTPISKR